MSLFRIGLLLLAVNGWGQMTPESSLLAPEISNLQLSPDGKDVLFVVGTADLNANTTRHRLMRTSVDGGAVTPVTGIPDDVADVRWAPDSKRFAYIAGKAIWVRDVTADNSTEICKYDHSNAFLSKEGNVLSWSPDGTQLAFAGTTEPAPGSADPEVIDRIQYKARTALSDNRRTHIYLVPVAGGTPRMLTSGEFDEHSIDWGGDGKEIFFLSNHEHDPDARLNYDVFAVDVTSGRVRQLTRTAGVELNPVVSPDGKWIACSATSRAVTTIDSVAEDSHIRLIPSAGGNGRDVNASLDRRSSSPQWSADGKAIYYLAADHGKVLIYSVPATGGASRPLFDKKVQVTAFSGSGSQLIYVMSDPTHPAEVYSGEGQMTHLNPYANTTFSAPQEIAYRSFDGTEVEGWLYPALSAGGQRVPMILSIHGGPHGQFGYAFSASTQLNAARGYATLTINPRGSSGYGQKFADGTIGDWGGGDYKDLMAGIDYVLTHHPEIDADRLGVTGSSYGGYMTNWIVTQTNRFKSAVAVSSLSNLISFYATSLYQDLIHAEFNGFPWDDHHFALLWKESPLAHVANVTTPTLLLHGESDNDVHITQAEEMFTALRQRGVTAEMVRYPREGHGFREPKHVLDSRVRVLEWMDRFLKADLHAAK